MAPETELPALLTQLRDDLGFRRIAHGIRKIEDAWPLIERVGPANKHAGVLLGLVAQWVDAGLDRTDWVRCQLGRFPASLRPDLSLVDYLHVRTAEGWLAMRDEDYGRAAVHFRFVDSLREEVADTELLAITNFWAGRCLRRAGQYDDALDYTARAETLALAAGYPQMAAIMQITESWLAFQRGRHGDAAALLHRAEEALRDTDDYLNRGNVQSAYGRIAQRQGRYEQALDYFEGAIAEYRRGGGNHLQLARTLLNIAFVKRLVALDMQKALEAGLASRRPAAEGIGGDDGLRERRRRLEEIREEARAQLRESMEIYSCFGNHHGTAGVLINSGLLHLDAGDLDQAESEAAEAFQHGEGKSDFIIMARARTLQCMVEYARIEDLIGDPVRHHAAAASLARDAVEFAGRTQNRRLLARAWVWQGMVFSAEPLGDHEAARRCCEEAMALLKPEGAEKEYVWDDLAALKSKVLQTRPVDPLLRAWSAGIVGDKSFQQITEEFARIVIPKVWEREGRKVSRVASALSVSPKKVRRVLHSAGLRA